MGATVKLIVGLGNPGQQYENTRHNAGAWFVEELARAFNVTLKPESKFHGLTGRIQAQGLDIRLLIPTTYMNRSGQATSAFANFLKIPTENILVAHDELDIPPGTIKLKTGGGHGGHNGLRDIIAHHSNNKQFIRLRIGIGHPGSSDKVTGYVLGRPPAKEHDQIMATIDEARRLLDKFANGDMSQAMNELHRFKAN